MHEKWTNEPTNKHARSQYLLADVKAAYMNIQHSSLWLIEMFSFLVVTNYFLPFSEDILVSVDSTVASDFNLK